MCNLISKILNIILDFGNRKLKGFELEKEIKIKETEIKELERKYLNEKEAIEQNITRYTNSGRSFRVMSKDYTDCNERFKNELSKLQAELCYLKRLKKYKWIFGK